MGFLFLDIETYSSEKNSNSSLNPYEQESKVLVISYSHYEGFKPPKKEEIKEPIFLKEWESNEKDILVKFYNFLKMVKEKDKWLKIIGFNILKFDLTYLFGRMKTLGISNEKEIYHLLFDGFNIDMYQLSSIISKKTKEYEQLWGINHKEASEFFKLQLKEGEGVTCSRFYDNKEYDKIMKYSKSEFNFEQMFDAFYLYVINI